MGYIKEKTAYLKGLADGLELGEGKCEKLLLSIIDVLDEIADTVDDHDIRLDDVEETIDELLDTLLEEADDNESDEEDGFFETDCPHCGNVVYFDEDMLDEEPELLCPNCGETFAPFDVKEE